MTDVAPNITVLIADLDSFESGYVATTLQASGAIVIGPLQSADEVRARLAAGPPPGAVVLGDRLADGLARDLIPTLREQNIAHLLLIGAAREESGDLSGIPVLHQPFGAYQVVQWAAQLAPPAGVPEA